MTLTIDYLGNHVHLVETVARWHWDEWGGDYADASLDKWVHQLHQKLHTDRLPCAWVAFWEGEPVGSVDLETDGVEPKPELTPDVSGLFVLPDYRNRGIGTALMQRCHRDAVRFGVTKVFLYTESAETLYARLGWVVEERLEFLGHPSAIMSRDLSYDAAADVLRDGGVVALPTDTVYGLCALAADPAAVETVYAIKERDPRQAMPIFVASMQQAETIGVMNDNARALAAAFWPGPLTIVIPKLPSYTSRALAGGATAALRIPGDPRLRALCEAVGPITGTSANIAGREECHTAAEVEAQIGPRVNLIVDAPVDAAGQPSTIIDCTKDPPAIVRHGAIPEQVIREILRK